MRREVVEHDVAQLEVRLRKGSAPQGSGGSGGNGSGGGGGTGGNGGNCGNDSNNTSRVVGNGAGHGVVTVGDYETLIHQCRKRKWTEEVMLIHECRMPF